ncbi:transcriptional regulator, SARP family [Oceanithermus profundus DSM 14977]|uniref:Transcriptional regulator, SARP family n=1 Tax=Oceanithermus profundus (strain DSM 14977 / NBRC 100410 / VKM B-2274 / 506) TaxID=670487 RepID=E4U850_OCEP5|nr:AAA family ATPase [Oceanithermus profundus]ADR36265.1 transcriptional regulator, SARP family [Oceanithermus profundus DSM 14977]
MAHGCRILLLGPPELWCGGARVHLPTARATALIAFLALQEEAVPRGRLAALLWDAPEATARHRLRQELYRLQRGPLGSFLQSDRKAVRLKGVESDAARFRAALERGAWPEALRLWRGPFMDGFALSGAEAFEDWLALEREAWTDRYVLALSRRALELEAEGRLEPAAQLWRTVVEADAFHEEAHRRLLWLLARSGRWPEADRLYRQYRERLERELGLEPDPETERLYRELAERKTPARPAAAPVPETLADPPLVGREALLRELQRLHPQPVLLLGEAGSGKTRLAGEHLARLGGRLIIEHPASSRALPFAGVARALDRALELQGLPELDPVWLREAGRLLPHRLPAPGRPLQGAADRTRFLEGLSRVLLALAGPVLVWDDLQWTDPAAVELLAYLLPAASRAGVQAVLTVRRPIPPGPVADWLEPLEDDLARLEVPPLDEAAVHELIQRLAHQRYGARLFARRLHSATGGNPFFVLETLRHLFARGELRLRGEGWSTPYDRTTEDYRELPIPRSIRETLWARLHALDGPLKRTLELVCVARSPVAPETLAQVLGVPELEAARHLEELRERQLTVDRAHGYAPAHEHLRALVLETLNPSLARTYHRAWARTLEAQGRHAQAAEHWQEAGLAERAAQGFIAAARRAPHDPLSARAYYLRALHLAEALDPRLRQELELDLLELDLRLGRLDEAGRERLEQLAETVGARSRLLIAEALLQRGDYPRALASARAGLARALREGDRACQARAHFLLAWIYYRHGDPGAQLAELEQALDAYLQIGDHQGAARTLRNLAALYFRLGEKETGDALQARALEEAQAVGDGVLTLRIRADRATGRWLRGEFPWVLREARALRRAARRLGDYGGELDALELEGLAALKLGDHAGAYRAFDAAVRRADELHLEKDAALARSERAWASIELGSFAEAESDLRTALAVQRRIGDQAKLGHTYHTWGYLHLRRGDHEEALRWFRRAARHWRARGERGHLARSLAYAALAAAASGRTRLAQRLSGEALRASHDWPVGVPDRPLIWAVYARFHARGAPWSRKACDELRRLRAGLRPAARRRLAATFVYRTVCDGADL